MTKEEQSQLILKMATELMGSRTCGNCKQYISYHKLCRQDVSIFGESFLSKDFGCNKWEKKDD